MPYNSTAPTTSVPGVVRTRPLTLPRQDTQVIKTEIIEVDLTPSSHMDSFAEDSDGGELTVSTEQLPTEVITKTITIEGDSTDLTQEEIEKLLSQAPEEVGDIGSFTSTQVVRVSSCWIFLAFLVWISFRKATLRKKFTQSSINYIIFIKQWG